MRFLVLVLVISGDLIENSWPQTKKKRQVKQPKARKLHEPDRLGDAKQSSLICCSGHLLLLIVVAKL